MASRSVSQTQPIQLAAKLDCRYDHLGTQTTGTLCSSSNTAGGGLQVTARSRASYNNVFALCKGNRLLLASIYEEQSLDGQSSSIQPQEPGYGCGNKDFGANESIGLEQRK
uniref:Uncharacterized protein n=1 Tax=Arundo donax TaxID=35708 RepID=A0A0A9DFN0_ARUDO